MKEIIVRPAAAADISDAHAWYEEQRAGLGNEFLTAVDHTLKYISEFPETYRDLHRNTRRALLERFPYGIYYRVYPNVIVIVACMHARRAPRVWQSRS